MTKAIKPEPEHGKPEEPVCSAGNTYTVENTTNPFCSVKFNAAEGAEIKEGGAETFTYTLPDDAVAGMTNMQVEVKAGEDSRVCDLVCDFMGLGGCEPVSDELFGVSFDGAQANEDDTFTLRFTVTVYGQHALSHVAFSLPEGQTAGDLTGEYSTASCVMP